jgi:hypothetical protein
VWAVSSSNVEVATMTRVRGRRELGDEVAALKAAAPHRLDPAPIMGA